MFKIFLGFIVLFSTSFAFAQDQTSAEAVIAKPWNLTVSTETSMQLGGSITSQYISELGQETALNFSTKLGASGYSVSIRQPLYNTFLESGANDSGSFSVGNTELNLKKASIGVVSPSDVNLGAGFRVVLPTGRVTPDLNDSGFISYLMPSISVTKTWSRVTLGTNLASRFYFFTKEDWQYYTYADKDAKEKTAKTSKTEVDGVEQEKAVRLKNPITRQILQGIFNLQATEKVAFATIAQLELDWKHNPVKEGVATGAPRFMIIPEVSYSPLDSVSVATGVVVGGSSQGAINLREWFKEREVTMETLLTNSTAYTNVSYTF